MNRILLVAAALTMGTALSLPRFSHAMAGTAFPDGGPSPATQDPPARKEMYTCPMHPSVRNEGPGRCPICGMDLTPAGGDGAPSEEDGRAVFKVSTARQQAIGVRHDVAAVRDLKKLVRAYGDLAVDERRVASVNLRYSGWIDTVAADYEGRFVRAGELLLRVYSPEALAAQREHLLSAAYAADTAWTVDALLGTRGFGSATRDRLLFLGFTDGQIGELERRGEASRTVGVVSPVSGNILEKMTTAGRFVEPGMTLYTIADLSSVWLNAEIYQSDLPEVRVGQAAEVSFPQHPGRTFHGEVTFIHPRLERETRSVRARIEIANADGALKPGMFGSVTMRTGSRRLLSVPTSAVLNTGTREIVFVDAGGDAIEARIVRTGFRNDRYAEILEGLHEGERVISSANFLIDAESRIQGVLDRLPAPAHDHGKDGDHD